MTRREVIDNYGYDPNNYTYCGEFKSIGYSDIDYFFFYRATSYRKIERFRFHLGGFYHHRKSDLYYITFNPHCLAGDQSVSYDSNGNWVKFALMEHDPSRTIILVEDQERLTYFPGTKSDFKRYSVIS